VKRATARRPSGTRFEIVSLVALVLAGLWCVVLLIGAMTLPVYSGESVSSGSPTGFESWRATLVEVNGTGALAVVALPAIPVAVVAIALWLRHRAQRRGSGAMAWTTVGVLGAFAFVTGFSIGMFVVPIVVLLTIACVAVNAPPRSPVR
jgi:hypothetical protein